MLHGPIEPGWWGSLDEGPAAPRGWEWGWLLFSFSGRANRAHYWAGVGVQIASFFVLLVVIGLLAGSDGESAVAALSLLVFLAFTVWVGFAVSIKRWHDRNKTGWWI